MLTGTITLRLFPSSPATFPHFKPPADGSQARVARHLGPLGAAPAARVQNTTVPPSRTSLYNSHMSWTLAGVKVTATA